MNRVQHIVPIVMVISLALVVASLLIVRGWVVELGLKKLDAPSNGCVVQADSGGFNVGDPPINIARPLYLVCPL